MEPKVHEDKTFEGINYSEKEFSHREFVDCTFAKCDFSKSNLSNNQFSDCTFSDCNLSMVQLSNSSLRNVEFIRCKLMGVQFGSCNDFLFSVSFSDCILDYSSFFQRKMKKTPFTGCSL
jgi:uncharacterized protein YjbI with pentapeptide repeats